MKKTADTNTSPAFHQLLEESKASIYRICCIYARAPLAPEDLFQEVVFQLWKSFEGFRGQSSWKTWAYRVALNVCMRAKMKWQPKHTRMVSLEAIEFQLTDQPVNEEQEEKHRLLRRCIAQLNEADQSIVILYLEDLPYRQIAAVTGLTENYVAVKMKRIRQKLFNCMTANSD